MSLAQLTLEDVVLAEQDVLDVHAIRLAYIYGDAAIERMVNLPAGGLDAFKDSRWKTGTADAPRPVYDLGYCHASNAFKYAWLGSLAVGLHAVDLTTDMTTFADFLKGSTAMETHDSQDFSYSTFKGLPSNEILISLASAVYARFAIEDGYDIPLEGVAALARVSDKTIRTAANPRFPDALKTVKQGNRTYVQAEDALDWLLRRPDFKPTQAKTELEEAYRGDSSHLAAFLADRRRRLQAAEFSAALKTAGFSEVTWKALEAERFDLSSGVMDGLTLLALGKALSFDSPRGFSVWVLELALNARKTSAELAHQAQLVQINQGLAEPSNTDGVKK